MPTRPFLSARWRHLLMINYDVPPELVEKRLPPGTELDLWQGRCLVSLVGFLFADTRLKGIPIPFHRDFEEVNLRYYLRRPAGPEREVRRAVGFVKEIVPDHATAWMARWLYNENYVARRMSHQIELASGVTDDAFRQLGEPLAPGARVAYEWREGDRTQRLAARADGDYVPLEPGSEPEFIAEHYWGYAAQRDGGCKEYQVVHPPWRACRVRDLEVQLDVETVYGADWVEALGRPPVSAFLAEGSEVAVMHGVRIDVA